MGPRHRKNTQGSLRRSAEDFRTLSYRISHYASRGTLRNQFQEEVSRMILDFSGCDAVELWLKDHGKYFRCEAMHRPEGCVFSETTFFLHSESEPLPQGSDQDPGLVLLCRDMLLGHLHLPHPFLTKHGTLWTGDIQKLIASLPEQDGKHGRDRYRMGDLYPSVALIPLWMDDEKIGMLQLKSKHKHYFQDDPIELYEDLAHDLGIALAHRHAQLDLRERVKELTCLYEIARVAARSGLSLEQMLQDIAELLPSAWLHPEIAFARIVLDGRSYTTSLSSQRGHRQVANIVVGVKPRGTVEVGYGEERPQLDEGPFLKEERNLIDMVARELAILIKRREVEEDQFKLQDQLRHADRLATIGQLAAGVAHELNEPLGNILGFAQLAKKCPALPRQAEQDIEKIQTASLNAREVIRKMLTFTRPIPPQKKRVSLNQVIEEGLYFFESRCAKEGVQIFRSLSPDLPEVFADPVQLNQVLVNLVINALQAMPRGGTLSIQTVSAEGHLSLIIEDTGIGMSEEVIKQIFTPFFTTKEIGQGTGLGLPVVHGIITSHGGSIHVESKVDRGTRFEIRLPIESLPSDGGD